MGHGFADISIYGSSGHEEGSTPIEFAPAEVRTTQQEKEMARREKQDTLNAQGQTFRDGTPFLMRWYIDNWVIDIEIPGKQRWDNSLLFHLPCEQAADAQGEEYVRMSWESVWSPKDQVRKALKQLSPVEIEQLGGRKGRSVWVWGRPVL